MPRKAMDKGLSKVIIRKRIVSNAVQSLREFGYLNVNDKNIFTVDVFKAFFLNMLKNDYNVTRNATINEVIQELIQELQTEKDSMSIPEMVQNEIPNTFIMNPVTMQEALKLLKKSMGSLYELDEGNTVAQEIRQYLEKNIFNKKE